MCSGLFTFMLELELGDRVGGLEGAFPFIFCDFSGLSSMVEEVDVEVEMEVRWAIPRAQCP